MFNILVITPIEHIPGVLECLQQQGKVTVLADPDEQQVAKVIAHYDVLFTNPNKSRVYLGANILEKATCLKVIVTASTGTVHIDKDYVAKRKMTLISLGQEYPVINKISSTAEHALALTMAALRHIPAAARAVLAGDWDYKPFIGRQINQLAVAVLGFGRLGQLYASYMHALGAAVTVYDPYKRAKIDASPYSLATDLLALQTADIISLHVHVNAETQTMIGADFLQGAKSSLLLINTARGEIVDERALLQFLKANPQACYATDVLTNEVQDKENNPLIAYAKKSSQVLITPHIGGMTTEGQAIAYNHAASMLSSFLLDLKQQHSLCGQT